MQDRGKKLSRWIYSVLTALIFTFGAFACGGGDQAQVGGIIGTVSFNTQACVPQQKILNFRNSDTQNPQRVMGVSFELGTNDKNNYKIDKVVVGGTEYTPTASLAQDVLIPAGGIMSVYVKYNPKAATNGNSDLSYLDLFMNGPVLGILQIKLDGNADKSDQNCSAGDTFKVNAIHVTIKASPGLSSDFAYDIPAAELTKPLVISGSEGNKTVTPDNFPSFVMKGSAIPNITDGGIKVDLAEETSVTYDGTNFNVDSATLKAAVISVTGKWSSGSSSATGNAPNSLSLTGSPLQDNKMKLVFTAVLNSDALASYGLNGGVVGFEMELEKQQ